MRGDAKGFLLQEAHKATCVWKTERKLHDFKTTIDHKNYDCATHVVKRFEYISSTLLQPWLSSMSVICGVKPAFFWRKQNYCWTSPLISMSTTISHVGEYFTSIVPSWTCSMTKMMSHVINWLSSLSNFWFLDISMAGRRSLWIVVVPTGRLLSSRLSLLIHTNFWEVLDKSTCS